jgi:hypothetical protein
MTYNNNAPRKVIVIDPGTESVYSKELSGPDCLQREIGGYIEAACIWDDTGDVLYVDEEGINKEKAYWFRIADAPHQPFAGKGVLVGREADMNTSWTVPPTLTVGDVWARVMFLKTQGAG